MRWSGLVDLVPRCRPTIARVDGRGGEIREHAAAVAAAAFPGTVENRDIADMAGACNIAMLAIASRCSPATWLARPSASEVVHGTDLHAIPDCAPHMLRAPGIVETRRPETGERLWGDIASLGWYPLDDAIFLIGLGYPDGSVVTRWTPRWTGEDLAPQLPALDIASPFIADEDRAAHAEFSEQAARYLIVLGLLLGVEGGPLRVELDRKTRWRHVYLGERWQAPRPAPPPSVVDVRGDRIVEQRPVTGHLKRQRHGAGLSLTKWIYIQGYEARRWCAPRWLVSRRDEIADPVDTQRE